MYPLITSTSYISEITCISYTPDWKPQNGIQQTLTGSKISLSSTKFVFDVETEKQDSRPGLWLAETFSTSLKQLNGILKKKKFNRNQDLNVLYQVCVFRVDPKKQDDLPGLWLAETFLLLLQFPKPLNGIQRILTGSKQDLNVLYQVCVFRKNKMAAPAGDWLR